MTRPVSVGASGDEASSAIDPPLPPRGHPKLLAGIAVAEDVVHYVIAAVLLVLAVLILYKTGSDLFDPHETVIQRVTAGVNGVLFVIIVMELLRTIIGHFERKGLQLKSFLIIGIISAVRHILTIGARLTLSGEVPEEAFRRSQIELGVNVAVVLGLAIGLLLVRMREPAQPASEY